jgi:hypothetical protein
MRPAVSTTIDRFGRSQYHIYLCTQAGPAEQLCFRSGARWQPRYLGWTGALGAGRAIRGEPGSQCRGSDARTLRTLGPSAAADPEILPDPEPHQVRGRDRDPGLYDLRHPSALGPTRSSAAEPPRRFYLAFRAPAGAGPRFRDGCTRRRPRVRDLTRYTRHR